MFRLLASRVAALPRAAAPRLAPAAPLPVAAPRFVAEAASGSIALVWCETELRRSC